MPRSTGRNDIPVRIRDKYKRCCGKMTL